MLELFMQIHSVNEDGTKLARLERITFPNGTVEERDADDDIDFMLVESYVGDRAILRFSDGEEDIVRITRVDESSLFCERVIEPGPVSLGQSRSEKDDLGRGGLFEVTLHGNIVFIYEDPEDKLDRIREVEVRKIYYGTSEDYPEGQWLLKGYDLDRKREYIFALNKMSHVRRI